MGTNATDTTAGDHHGHGHDGHGHGGPHDHDELDWDAMGDRLELEGDLAMPMLDEALAWLGEVCTSWGTTVRTVLDVGSGPGVGACALALAYEDAQVVAVDPSPELLARAERRAARFGVDDRVTTMAASLPDGVDEAPEAHLVWASMVIHHVADPAAALDRLRHRLRPGGLIALAEFADPWRFLPADLDLGRPGLAERVDAASAHWIATLGSNGHEGAPPAALPGAVAAAGLEIVAERVVRHRIDPPLSVDARQHVRAHVVRMAEMETDLLDADDRATLETLADPSSPNGILARPDVFYETSRRLLALRPT
ncbi:MAG: class I SAM-dependent methyltransferase [Actinomycetota bacterium]|nr:class I SAM-dependent methyltransferase [Actinomycetota bacterium]